MLSASSAAVVPISVHYESSGGLPVLSRVEREVDLELSLLGGGVGSVSVEEHFALHNAGAALVGGFSRIDYHIRQQKGNSIRELTALLPAGASEVYYRDVIGNISSSHVRPDKAGVTLQIEPRFPVFGGWRTEWYQGYQVSTDAASSGEYLRMNGDGSLTLSFPVHIPYEGLPIEHYSLRVILPDAADILQVRNPLPHISVMSRRYGFLDAPWMGRPVLVMSSSNVVSSLSASPSLHGAGHGGGGVQPAPGHFEVTFRLPTGSMWFKPVYVTVILLLLLVAVSMLSRLQLLSFSTAAASSAAEAPAPAAAAPAAAAASAGTASDAQKEKAA